jgi:protein-S-isoprenylcysteine O-methyltransferase Ste14
MPSTGKPLEDRVPKGTRVFAARSRGGGAAPSCPGQAHQDGATCSLGREIDVRRFRMWINGLGPYVLAYVVGTLTLGQIALAFVLSQPDSEILDWAGWICLWTAGLFGVLPILTLRRQGHVPAGKGYMHTTRLVDKGIYALVRHPQGGVAGLLISLGVALIAPHWLVIALGLVAMGLTYIDTFKEDQRCIDRFGDDYRRYMQQVPRVNVVAGAIRWLQRRTGGANP